MTNPLITASQAAILQRLREVPSLPTADLRPKHLALSTHGRHIIELIKTELIDITQDRQGATGQCVAITMTGRRRLAAYQREQDLIATKALRVPPRTYNIFAADYVPTPPPWCRNNGHIDKCSLGAGC